MAAVFIEHRPHASYQHFPTSYYVIVIDGKEIGAFSTVEKAKKTACAKRHHPIYVARQRHLQDRDQPDHWRIEPCWP